MSRFSMYSGEELELENNLSMNYTSPYEHQNLYSDVVESKRKRKQYQKSSQGRELENLRISEDKENNEQKSSDDETFMSSLALVEDSIEPFIVSENTNICGINTMSVNDSGAGGATDDTGYDEDIKVQRISFQSDHSGNRVPRRKIHNTTTLLVDPERKLGKENISFPEDLNKEYPSIHDQPGWYSKPPPAPPPFPKGSN